jgi:hypothetical protein
VVAVDGRPEVELEEVAVPQHGGVGAVMRDRGVRAGGHDRLEARGLGAQRQHPGVEFPADLQLGATRPQRSLGGQLGERLVGDGTGLAQGLDLPVVLDRAQRLDEAAAWNEVEPAAGQRLPVRVGDGVRFEAEPAVEQLRERDDQRALRLDELDALDRAPGLGVAEVAEQPHAVGLDQQRRVRAREADEVADVDAVRDEQRLFEALAQAVDPRHVRSARNSRASR